MLRRMRKAQSTAEYAIVIGLVIGAAVAMQIYVKRGLQAKVKGAIDYNDPASTKKGGGSNDILGVTTSGQFEPDYLTTTGDGMHAENYSQEKIATTEGGAVARNIIGEEKSTRTGTQVVAAP